MSDKRQRKPNGVQATLSTKLKTKTNKTNTQHGKPQQGSNQENTDEHNWLRTVIISSLHDKYVIVPADKASNNIVFVCKSYYFECLIKELGINSNTSSNITYKPTSFDKDEILANHRSFMTSLNIPSGKESEDLPYLYWIPKLHKTPYKERYIAGSSTCSTKELSIHLTKILSAVKEGQQKYCETVYSRSGINHMWILKNSKDLLDNLKSRSFSQVSSIKTFDFSTLYTTLPHDKLKTRLKETIHKAFSHRNYGSKFVVLDYNSTYFSNKFIKVKHATPRNKWSVCWSSSSITYLSPLEGHCFSRSSAYQWVRIVPLF